MNLSKIILLVLMLSPVLVSAQDTIQKYPMVTTFMGDTVIVFGFEQGLELSQRNEERKECLIRKDILEQRIVEKDVVITQQEEKIQAQDTIIAKYEENEEAYEDLIEISEEEKKALKKEIKRQKRGKVIAIIGAGVISVVAILGLVK